MLAAWSEPVYFFLSNLCQFRSKFAWALPLSFSSRYTIFFSETTNTDKKWKLVPNADLRDSFTAREVCEGVPIQISVIIYMKRWASRNRADLRRNVGRFFSIGLSSSITIPVHTSGEKRCPWEMRARYCLRVEMTKSRNRPQPEGRFLHLRWPFNTDAQHDRGSNEFVHARLLAVAGNSARYP